MPFKLTKVSRAMMRKSIRLLDMEYKPSEIADELGANSHYILSLIAGGAPARKDASGRYWVHGLTFKKWLDDAAPKNIEEIKKRPTIADNECYCVTCKKITTYTERMQKGRVSYGVCPSGHKVARFLPSVVSPKGKKKK